MNVAGVLVFAVTTLLAPIFLVALFAVVTVALVEMDSYVKVSHSQMMELRVQVCIAFHALYLRITILITSHSFILSNNC